MAEGEQDSVGESIKRAAEEALDWVKDHADCEHDWKVIDRLEDHDFLRCTKCSLGKFEKHPRSP